MEIFELSHSLNQTLFNTNPRIVTSNICRYRQEFDVIAILFLLLICRYRQEICILKYNIWVNFADIGNF